MKTPQHPLNDRSLMYANSMRVQADLYEDGGPYGNGTAEGAKVIAASSYENGPTIYTVQATGKRFILAELNTHRTFSRNSASSRAIPFPKQVKRILEDLSYPLRFPAEQPGMQGGDALDGPSLEEAREIWQQASWNAVDSAQELADMGVHKSVINRIIEPYMRHTVVITATAWDNFFNQRCSPLAQPEIEMLANDIRTAIQNFVPAELDFGEWHLPYVADDYEAQNQIDVVSKSNGVPWWQVATEVSSARCARTSYLTQEGKRDVVEDLSLYGKLVNAKPEPHWSPLEHVATPWPENRQANVLGFTGLDNQPHTLGTGHLPQVGNLLGWRSLRTEVETARGLRTFR